MMPANGAGANGGRRQPSPGALSFYRQLTAREKEMDELDRHAARVLEITASALDDENNAVDVAWKGEGNGSRCIRVPTAEAGQILSETGHSGSNQSPVAVVELVSIQDRDSMSRMIQQLEELTALFLSAQTQNIGVNSSGTGSSDIQPRRNPIDPPAGNIPSLVEISKRVPKDPPADDDITEDYKFQAMTDDHTGIQHLAPSVTGENNMAEQQESGSSIDDTIKEEEPTVLDDDMISRIAEAVKQKLQASDGDKHDYGTTSSLLEPQSVMMEELVDETKQMVESGSSSNNNKEEESTVKYDHHGTTARLSKSSHNDGGDDEEMEALGNPNDPAKNQSSHEMEKGRKFNIFMPMAEFRSIWLSVFEQVEDEILADDELDQISRHWTNSDEPALGDSLQRAQRISICYTPLHRDPHTHMCLTGKGHGQVIEEGPDGSKYNPESQEWYTEHTGIDCG